jgi:hypothetical protein
MNGITIVEQACPRCAQPRTVRVGLSSTFVCFNCRQLWSGLQPESVAEAAAPFDYPFTGTEVRRLHVYRAAVRAAFYTDW